jgi:hypothetical protein
MSVMNAQVRVSFNVLPSSFAGALCFVCIIIIDNGSIQLSFIMAASSMNTTQ